MRTCVRVIVCVLLERFELAVAAGGRAGLLGEPAALAPEPGRELFVGEVSQAAEAFGIHAGMRMGEALSRCPALALVPPDPMGVAEAWECALARLENLGAAVESLRPGEACFDARGLQRLHCGRVTRMLADGYLAAGAQAQGSDERLRRVLAAPRIGQGPTRFCAMVAAHGARVRRPATLTGAQELASHPVALLRRRTETVALVEPLERLGVATLGFLAELPRAALADRFGRPGLLAHDLANGLDTPLRPRKPGELLRETLELPESGSGEQLGRALWLLIDRLLARRERRGRTLRAVVLSARLVEGGTWRERVVFREALADGERMRLALDGRLALLPAPAETLELTVERFGPPHPEARALFDDGAVRRDERLREAVRQARAAAGPDAALRILEIDPDSRVPERRVVLTPFEPGGSSGRITR
ncbi:MAG: protein ImuB [Solirubrobacteraceae bacterium]|nr:protein ImuB [Solirubrobacteraceae bacterium]